MQLVMGIVGAMLGAVVSTVGASLAPLAWLGALLTVAFGCVFATGYAFQLQSNTARYAILAFLVSGSGMALAYGLDSLAGMGLALAIGSLSPLLEVVLSPGGIAAAAIGLDAGR